ARHVRNDDCRILPRTTERCEAPQMTLLSLIETTSGQYSLLLEAGTTQVDDLIRELDHEPMGTSGRASLKFS
ncbi:hypothetical protein ACWDXH_10240, partial [Micromonospora chokoriensis]